MCIYIYVHACFHSPSRSSLAELLLLLLLTLCIPTFIHPGRARSLLSPADIVSLSPWKQLDLVFTGASYSIGGKEHNPSSGLRIRGSSVISQVRRESRIGRTPHPPHTMALDATSPGAAGANGAASKPVVCFLGPVSSYTHQVRMYMLCAMSSGTGRRRPPRAVAPERGL